MTSKKEKILKGVHKLRKSSKEGEREFYESLANDPKAKEKLQKYVTKWSDLYSLSFIEFLALFAAVAGIDTVLEKAAKHSEPLNIKESFLDQMKDFELSTDALESQMGTDEARKTLTSFIMALHFNVKALAHRNRTICDMVEQVRTRVERYEEIIFEAVSIDPSVITNAEIAEYISRWTSERNTVKLGKLSKAIVGKYPIGSRTVGLDDYRFMIAALEDIDGTVTVESVYEMNQLLKLITEGKDIGAAMQKHLYRRSKDARTSNA
ncbi:hypothetical protein [Pseudidiomarina piscicola]|uniref:hypothetical protein n=1 Tax=Pseudidiomarina piscicola TaxID=2614830 RepID=UPI00156E3717|nr:hypothetical protein [Pseudidiomarina piscicola]